MKITDVKVFPVDEDKLKAYATITFDNCFIVRDLKVISGNKGYFIAMPSKKRKDGTFRDVAHPLNSETRKMIEDAVLDVYEKENVPGSAPAAVSDDDSSDADSKAADLGEEPGIDESAETANIPDGELSDGDEPEGGEREALGAEDTEPIETSAAKTTEAERESEGVGTGEPEETENKEKGAEENPVIEPSDDPEKAFGYEE